MPMPEGPTATVPADPGDRAGELDGIAALVRRRELQLNPGTGLQRLAGLDEEAALREVDGRGHL